MNSKQQHRQGTAYWAPIGAAVLVLLGSILHGGVGTAHVKGTEEYMLSVEHAVNDIPYHIGPWVGEDVRMTEPARRLLQPNVVLSRKYIDHTTNTGFSLLIVHCKDVRDMIGHWPPVCYPGQGFREVESDDINAPQPANLYRADLLASPDVVRRYRFVRENEIPAQKLIVYNFFARPTGKERYAVDIRAIEKISGDRRIAGLGSAQIQLVLSDNISEEIREQIIQQVFDTIHPAISAIIKGPIQEKTEIPS
ncbi:MAG: exosortase-associated EpsI family protein [Phycisphaeraceae bacterium]|nr:exosortase-associated EpsI family protein [Phycisphaerales bacterium]MCB9860992.1 exosortase-associated EpsI family protein [Phycisphaeraceae bacterium]